MSFVLDQGNNHAVEVEEEQDEMEAELREGLLWGMVSFCPVYRPCRLDSGVPYLLVHIKLPENLGRVQEMGVVEDPRSLSAMRPLPKDSPSTYFLTFHPRRGRLRINGSQYPLIRNMNVRNPWTATSGMM